MSATKSSTTTQDDLRVLAIHRLNRAWSAKPDLDSLQMRVFPGEAVQCAGCRHIIPCGARAYRRNAVARCEACQSLYVADSTREAIVHAIDNVRLECVDRGENAFVLNGTEELSLVIECLDAESSAIAVRVQQLVFDPYLRVRSWTAEQYRAEFQIFLTRLSPPYWCCPELLQAYKSAERKHPCAKEREQARRRMRAYWQARRGDR